MGRPRSELYSEMSIKPLSGERELEGRRHLQGQEVVVSPASMVAMETDLLKECTCVGGHGVSVF